MKINIIRDIETFKGLEHPWNDLYIRAESKSVFESFNFNYYSWIYQYNSSKNSLALVSVYRDNDLIAVFPFYLDNRKRIRFINDIHSDACDFIGLLDVDFNAVIYNLHKEFKINSFTLINLQRNAKIINKPISLFRSYIDKISAKYFVLDIEEGVFPDNVPEYKSKQRTEFRRILKKNKEKSHEILCSKDSLFPFESICLLRDSMINRGIRGSSFLSSRKLSLIEKLYYQEQIIISIVKQEKEINAISFVMKNNHRYLIWIDIYDESKMINLFNYISLFSSLSFNNSVSINFGRGEYFYKKANFLAKDMNLSSLYIFNSRSKELICHVERILLKFMRNIYNMIK